MSSLKEGLWRFGLILGLLIMLILALLILGQALVGGTPNHQTLRCDCDSANAHYLNEASMTDNLQGDLLTLSYVALDDALTWQWAANPKLHDTDGLLASIQTYGFRDPSIYDGTLPGIAAGNGRLQALDQLRTAGEHVPRGVALDEGGTWHVPIIFGADAVSQAMAEAFGLDHNQLTVIGFKRDDIPRLWRQDDYLALLQRLSDEDAVPVSVAADDVGDWLALLDEAVVSEGEDPGAALDRAAELRAQWGTEPGQLWEIPSLTVPGGCHRLLCGDSTHTDDVQRLMDGQRARLFATDPPYLVDYDGTNHPSEWSKGDPVDKKNKDWSASYKDWDRADQGDGLYDGFVNMAVEHAITEDAAWYCWHASKRQAMLEAVWEQYGAFVHQQIIWAKDRPVLTRSWYMWQHEPCFFGWIKGNKPARYAEDYPATVWHFPTTAPGQSTDHPTSKPTDLFVIPMQQHTRTGDVCYEPFSGSGSQHIAGEMTGRLVYGMEIAPEFVAVILERLAGMGLEPRQVVSESVGA